MVANTDHSVCAAFRGGCHIACRAVNRATEESRQTAGGVISVIGTVVMFGAAFGLVKASGMDGEKKALAKTLAIVGSVVAGIFGWDTVASGVNLVNYQPVGPQNINGVGDFLNQANQIVQNIAGAGTVHSNYTTLNALTANTVVLRHLPGSYRRAGNATMN